MSSTNALIKTVTLATTLAIASLPAWSVEANTTKKKSAKSAVTALQAGTINSDTSMDPSVFRNPLIDTIGGGTNGTSKPSGRGTVGGSQGLGTGGNSRPQPAQSPS